MNEPAPGDSLPALGRAVTEIAAAHPDLRLGWGRGTGAAVPLSRLNDPQDGTLDRWLDATATLAIDLDDKTKAAYLLSIFTWHLGQALAGLYLSGAPLPALAARDVHVELAAQGPGGGLDIDFHLQPAATGVALDREAMAASIIQLGTPLLDGLFARTRFARRAMWRLVTDGMAAGFLAFGKRTGTADVAMCEAEAILRQPATPLGNPHWRFVHVQAAGKREAFRLRGGCCRLYRSPGHDFCTTCVLRREDDQIDRLTKLVARRAGG